MNILAFICLFVFHILICRPDEDRSMRNCKDSKGFYRSSCEILLTKESRSEIRKYYFGYQRKSSKKIFIREDFSSFVCRRNLYYTQRKRWICEFMSMGITEVFKEKLRTLYGRLLLFDIP
jgi:hypothetical protein